MIGYGNCPRCGGMGMEHLQTHSHCWDCNYFPDQDEELNFWSRLEFKNSSICAQRRMEDDLILAGRSSTDERSGGSLC